MSVDKGRWRCAAIALYKWPWPAALDVAGACRQRRRLRADGGPGAGGARALGARARFWLRLGRACLDRELARTTRPADRARSLAVLRTWLSGGGRRGRPRTAPVRGPFWPCSRDCCSATHCGGAGVDAVNLYHDFASGVRDEMVDRGGRVTGSSAAVAGFRAEGTRASRRRGFGAHATACAAIKPLVRSCVGGKPNATVVRSCSMRVPARADRYGASGKTGRRHRTGVLTGLQATRIFRGADRHLRESWVNTTSLNTTYGVLRFQIKLE